MVIRKKDNEIFKFAKEVFNMAGEGMGMTGIGLGDAMVLAQRGMGGGYGGGYGGENMWNNPLMWIFALGMMNNGFGGWGGGGGGANGVVTRAELQMGFNDQDTRAGIRGIQQGICDSTYALTNAINQTQHAISDCCCTTNNNIERTGCNIVNAIHNEGEATRALINANTMDALREKLSNKDRELQTANFQLSQQAQNATIINALRPTPVPAYITCSPYTSYNANCGCGCGSGGFGGFGNNWAA